MAPETPAAACRETPAKLPKATVWVLLLVFAIYLPALGNDYAVVTEFTF